MYGILPYYLSKLVIEMPTLILAPMIMLLMVYWVIGFNNTLESFF